MEWAIGGTVAGVDEAGRGPLAGPVVAAAVILDPANIPPGINDSKKLTRRRREALFTAITDGAVVAHGIADVAEIDRLNILQATMLAMGRAVAGLTVMPAMVLVDGNRCPDLAIPARAVIRGDAMSLSIAAASIIAKVTRDRIMAELARRYPDYGWERNAGYGTAEHRAALNLVGISPHHRKSFAPVRKLETQDSALSN